EMNRQLYASVNGYATNYFRREVISKHRSFVFSDRPQINELIKESQLVQQFMENINTPCDSPACSAKANDPIERFFNYFQQDNKNQLPVEERVNFNTIQSTIAKELNNRGIDITFNFGIFSRATNNFVVTNDEVAVRTTSWPADEKPNTRQLFASRYRVNLFPGDAISPGLLMVYFPLRTSYVWSSLWLNFLGSIAFTGIILFCFAYTIQVIFRQKKLSEMKNDFINNMTHEFKTPIATISLASDSIINPTYNGTWGVNEYTDEKNGKVTYDLKAQNSILLGDSTHIANVIHNLLDNANKYSPSEPNIVVATQSVSGGIEVIFTDNGIGNTREDRKYIFDKFYRVHTGNLHDIKGFGMGLSYVKAI
ncbi:MAG: sensor histidine kinase, partial [Minisyncoccia bacterium]